ncbi:MAG TPA: TonB-dependent receptor [Opitutaceae bacterium]|nr:TonB-dependent receptor [Opitutaceae bacterium]
MKRFFLPIVALGAGASLCAQTSPVVALPGLTVYSERVANQSGAATFAAPVTALRYEPGLDIQARNAAEGQADITLRGGIFENSGFRVGAISLLDPQTGHYLAEVPIAPAMLSSPQIFTGADNAMNSLNANVGTVVQGWRPVPAAGFASVAVGNHGMNRQEFYQGIASNARGGGYRVAADVAYARSESDGSVEFGDHRFSRMNARLQLAGSMSQTDVFAGYQEKFFGWPNLYTPFNSKESENLQTVLFAVNHRVDLGKGDFVEAGAHHRRNKDDYAFNRFAPLGPVHPFQHTTWASGAALAGRRTVDAISYNFRAEMQRDDIKSTSLTAGRYHSRQLTKLVFVPERSWSHDSDARVVAKAGVTFDDSNRTGSAWSPVFEIARERPTAPIRRVYFSYAKTTQLPNYTILNSSAAAGLFRGNPDLGRESSENLELGVNGLFAGWEGRAAAFYRRDDSLVDWTFRRGVTARAANAVDVDTAGFEAVARHSWQRFDVVLGYTVLAKEADYRGALVDASFYALNYARHRFTAAFVMRLGSSVEIRMDNVARVQEDNLLRQIGGDDTLMSSCGIVFRPRSLRGCELSLQADNLWNSNYQEVPAVPAARRQISAGASYTW